MSVVHLSNVLIENSSFRIDSTYFQKEFLQSALQGSLSTIGATCIVKSGTTPPDREDGLEEGVILLKTTDIRGTILTAANTNDFYYIQPEIAARMVETKLTPNDVLINIVGATTDVIGRVALVPDDFPEANITQAMALLRVTDNSIRPAFLFTFLLGKYGNQQVRRMARPTGQYNLNLPEVRSFKLPRLTKEFQDKIEQLISRVYTATHEGKALYSQAENYLLNTLSLGNWQPPQPLSYEQTFNVVFGAGRLDAEHFQPKYVALFSLLEERGMVHLGDYLTESVKRGISPEYVEDGDLLVINSRHVGRTHVDIETDRYTLRRLLQLQPQVRGEVHFGDVLLNSTGRDTIGRCQCLLEDIEAVVDNHIAIIRPTDELDPVYLACYLNALPGHMQTEQGWTGSSGQIELRPEVVEDYRIWNAPPEIQQAIRRQIEKAHVARRQAKRLLEAAKRAVEIAIENSEATALQFLESINATSTHEEA